MKNTYKLIAISVTSVLLANCSNKPTFGETLKAQGGDMANIGDKWEKGDRMIKKGQDMIEDGEEMQEDGKEKVEDGQELIEEGQKLKTGSEQKYNSTLKQQTVPVAPTN